MIKVYNMLKTYFYKQLRLSVKNVMVRNFYFKMKNNYNKYYYNVIWYHKDSILIQIKMIVTLSSNNECNTFFLYIYIDISIKDEFK